MISFGIGNNIFAPTRDIDETGTYTSNMDRWTFLMKDFFNCPTDSKRKGKYIGTPPRKRPTQTPPTKGVRSRQIRKSKREGIPDKNSNANQI
jgi:hypothetical protein